MINISALLRILHRNGCQAYARSGRRLVAATNVKRPWLFVWRPGGRELI